MKKIPFANIRESQFAFPLMLLLICLIAFGILIPSLGFYWDDWLIVFHIQSERISDLSTLYSYDRPLSVWTAILSGSLLGVSPFAWQLFSLVLRWLAALALWLALRALWPRRTSMIAWVSLLFAVYPAYTLQPISLAFSQHWIAYALYFLSLASMAWALQNPSRRLLYTLISLITAALHLITMEYFAGLELIRPLYLYLLLAPSTKDEPKIAKRIMSALWPYLLLWLFWAIWRLFFIQFPVDPHPPVLLSEFRAAPLATFLAFIETIIKSFTHILFSTWQQLLSPDLIDFSDRAGLLFWLIAALAGTVSYFLGKNLIPGEKAKQSEQSSTWDILHGLLLLFLGLFPVWLIGEMPIEVGYNERFALPALFGAALFWISLIWTLIENSAKRRLVLSLMLTLAIAGHLRAANVLRLEWRQQQSYYSQLAWRAPLIKANTAIITFGTLSNFMPVSSTAAAVNTLYAQSANSEKVDYWYFDLNLSRNVRVLENGQVLSSNYRGMRFEAQDPASNLFFYQAENACLWLLSPIHAQNDYLPFEVRQFVVYSNPDRIQANNAKSNLSDSTIFDSSPQETWCYYYQSAERLGQNRQWTELIALMQAAERKGQRPNVAIEWLPWVEAHAQLGQWALAEKVSLDIHQKHIRNDSLLCAFWEEMQNEMEWNAKAEKTRERVKRAANCAAE